jgi:hypothetical protein
MEIPMKTNDATRATAQALPGRIDLIDELQRAKELIDCIYLASHGLGDRMQMNALARISSDATDIIESVQAKLEGGAA